jgi:hypothetical protein
VSSFLGLQLTAIILCWGARPRESTSRDASIKSYECDSILG